MPSPLTVPHPLAVPQPMIVLGRVVMTGEPTAPPVGVMVSTLSVMRVEVPGSVAVCVIVTVTSVPPPFPPGEGGVVVMMPPPPGVFGIVVLRTPLVMMPVLFAPGG